MTLRTAIHLIERLLAFFEWLLSLIGDPWGELPRERCYVEMTP